MLNSYSPENSLGSLACIPDEHWQFVQGNCLKWFMTDHYIFTHATPDADKPLEEQSDTALFWNKFVDPQPHLSGKILVCGHTPQRDGMPINLGHSICLDTAACEGQWLTCLEVNSGEVWQANQQGQMRHSNIQEYRKDDAKSADNNDNPLMNSYSPIKECCGAC